jgi:hypothetical protein
VAYSLPISTQLLRDFGPLPGDEEEYARFAKPYRGGILSERRLRDKRVSRERLVKDSIALRHALREATEELVDFKAWKEAKSN